METVNPKLKAKPIVKPKLSTARKLSKTWSHVKKYKMLYAIALPGVLYFLIFKYIPLFGSIIAFKDYNVFQGVFGSPWVEFKHFRALFQNPDSMRVLKNTLILAFYDIFTFPLPLILALLLNEIRIKAYKKIVQTIVYIPHFLSWVIISGIFIAVLSPSSGLVNQFIQWLGHDAVYFMGSADYIRPILIISKIWQSIGWNTIVYLAALTAINPELYEAAGMDGANRWQQTWNITIPSILPTFVTLLLLQMGNFLDFGFERVYNFINPLNAVNAEILDTYIYTAGVLQSQYSFTTAIGLLKSVVGLLLVWMTNYVSKKVTGNSLY